MKWFYSFALLFLGMALIISCKNETTGGNNTLNNQAFKSLKSNQVIGSIDGEEKDLPNKRAAGGEKEGVLRLILTFDDGASGITCSMKSTSENIIGEHKVLTQSEIVAGKDVSVRFNERNDEGFNIYTSKSCTANTGVVSITQYDTDLKRVSGHFFGDACLVTNSGKAQREKVSLEVYFKEVSLVNLQW